MNVNTMLLPVAPAQSQTEPAAAQPQRTNTDRDRFQKMLNKLSDSRPSQERPERASAKRPAVERDEKPVETQSKTEQEEPAEEALLVAGSTMLLNITKLDIAQEVNAEGEVLDIASAADALSSAAEGMDIMPDPGNKGAFPSVAEMADDIVNMLEDMELVTDPAEANELLAQLEGQLSQEPDAEKVTNSIERFLFGKGHEAEAAGTDEGSQEALPLEAHERIGALMRAHAERMMSGQGKGTADAGGQDASPDGAGAEDVLTGNTGEDIKSGTPVAVPFSQALESLNQQAAAQAPQGEAPVQITPKFIYDQIVEQVSFSAKDSAQEIDIIIRPEFLGRMAIKLAMDGDKLTAQIRTANSNVHSVIASELTALQQALREKGIEVAEMTVVYDNHTREDLSGDSARRQPQQDGSKRRRAQLSFSDSIYSSPTYEELLMGILPEMGQMGVEYKV